MSIASVVNDTVTSVSVVNALKPLPPTITNYSVGGVDDTALDPAGGQTVQINGTGFLPGATITFDGSAVAVVTYVSPNRLTFTSPAKTAGTYTIYVVNADGGTAIYIPGIIYSLLPTWTTSAGTLGSYYETTSISNTVVASGDAPITYSLYSGSLPTGATLYANGVISGSAPVDSSSTTYSFTIQATDAQLQDSTRSFSLTINTDAVTWVSPANATTYTSAVDSAIANVTLSATDAAGYSVTYSANALPTGLSLSGANISGTPTVIADSSTLLTATAGTTNRTSTRTINWSITVANDPYFEYNTLLIPGASTTFVDDASTNNFAVTINGDTKPNNFNPYTPGYYSNYFDGSGDFLSNGSATGINVGTGSFTVEAWVYLNSNSNYSGVFSSWYSTVSNTGIFLGFLNSGILYAAVGTAIGSPVPVEITGSSAVSTGVWHHVALVRNGTSHKLYLDGTNIASTTATATSVNTTVFNIGKYYVDANNYYINGYISNLRFTNTAVYTANFTPSAIPLTAISGTQLLTCQSNRFVDNSTNAQATTPNGDTKIQSFQPFIPNSSYSTYGSGYFDGTGDYLTVPNNTSLGMGSGNFTVEFWVYQTSLVSYRQILDVVDGNSVGRLILWVDSAGTLYNLGQNGNARNTTAAGAITINTWIHVALVRSSGTTKFYINGTQSGSNYTDSTNYTCTTGSVYIGINSDGGTYPYQGYLTDFRMVKGTAVYTTTFTPPSAPLTAISGTSLLTLQNNQSVNNSTFLDNSSGNLPVTYVGLATQGTFSPYGGNWSNYFDGSGDYLTIANNAAFNFGTGAFTIECWFMLTADATADQDGSRGATLLCAFPNSGAFSSDWALGLDGNTTTTGTSISFAARQSGTQQYTLYTSTVTKNVWHHVAVTRTGNTLSLYYDGVRVSQNASFTNTVNSGGFPIKIGALLYSANQSGYMGYFPGYISNVRVVAGSVLYTGTTYTVPTTPLTPITGTSLLTCADNRLVDDSINNFTITKNGDVSVQRFSPFNPSSLTPTSYSGYFDGTVDYLSCSPSSSQFGTGDFTIECWIYTTSLATAQVIIDFRTSPIAVFGQVYIATDGTVHFYLPTDIATTNTVTINTWNHIAISRSAGTLKMFINGVSGYSAANSGTYNAVGTYIGISISGSAEFRGYISNMRLVTGTGVYTSNFTPPTSPLTAISGTSLLTLQSPTFIDNSTNNYTITVAGNSQPTIQNPFGYSSLPTQGYTPSTIGGSNYSNNTGTIYSNIASPISGTTMDWTMEAWVYFNSLGSTSWIFGLGNNTGGNTPYVEMRTIDTTAVRFAEATTVTSAWAIQVSYTFTAGQWYHFAGTRSGNTIRLFINGIQIGSTTYSSAIQSGMKPFTQGLLFSSGGARSDGVNGYISDTRMIAGTALYTSNFVPPIQPLQAIKNTSWLINGTSASIYDSAMMNDMQTINGASLNTALSKFGGSSMYFDGTDDHIQATNIQPLGSGDFTFEMWIYPLDTASRHVFSFGASWSPANGISMIQYGGNFALSCGTGWAPANAGQAIEINGWHHIALVRNSTAVKFYYDGVMKGSGTDSTNLTATGIDIGYVFSGGAWGSFYGYIDDLRITKGYARYTSNFTPPTAPFQTY